MSYHPNSKLGGSGGSGGLTEGSTGVWTLLEDHDLTGDQTTYEYTWDESTYNEIKIKLRGIQPQTDAVSFYCIVGHTNGGTMFNSTNDYDGSEKLYESASWSALADTDLVRLAPSCSSASDELISADVIITAGSDTELGCLIKIDLLYINSSSNMRANQVTAFLDGSSSAAIDTVRFYWASSAAFANLGSIKVYGFGSG